MNVQEMAKVLREYEQAVAQTNVYRYTNSVKLVAENPDVFGMNFAALIPASKEDQPGIFLAQERRSDILRRLMTGAEVGSDELQEAFGFCLEELNQVRAEQNPIKKELPANLCVLCFDDSLKSQYEIALPILKEYGFGATFFIAEKQESPMGPGFENKDVYMTWDEIKAIQDAGFEIGNHSLHHVFGSHNMGREFNLEQTQGMEAEFEAHGIRKPVSYAYPSGISNPEVVAVARECGYTWGRGNQEKGEGGIRGMTYYDPLQDSPLAMCNFGDPDFYTEEFLINRIRNTPAGMVFGLTYHDVSADTWPGACSFERQMEVLKEMGIKVISMEQLGEYIDPEKAYEYTKD